MAAVWRTAPSRNVSLFLSGQYEVVERSYQPIVSGQYVQELASVRISPPYVVKDCLPAVQQNLGIHNFHRQIQICRELPGFLKEPLAPLRHTPCEFVIPGRGKAQNLSDERTCQRTKLHLRGGAHDDANFLPARTADNHAVAAPASHWFVGLKGPELSSTTVAQKIGAISHGCAFAQLSPR